MPKTASSRGFHRCCLVCEMEWRTCLRAHKVLRDRQPALHHDRARQIDYADDEECIAPVEMMGDHAGDDSARRIRPAPFP